MLRTISVLSQINCWWPVIFRISSLRYIMYNHSILHCFNTYWKYIMENHTFHFKAYDSKKCVKVDERGLRVSWWKQKEPFNRLRLDFCRHRVWRRRINKSWNSRYCSSFLSNWEWGYLYKFQIRSHFSVDTAPTLVNFTPVMKKAVTWAVEWTATNDK